MGQTTAGRSRLSPGLAGDATDRLPLRDFCAADASLALHRGIGFGRAIKWPFEIGALAIAIQKETWDLAGSGVVSPGPLQHDDSEMFYAFLSALLAMMVALCLAIDENR